MWLNSSFPERKIFLTEVLKRNLKDKTILLLGNGDSLKELYFLKLGANIIYSDLSINAVHKAQQSIDLKYFKNKVVFCGIDANNIPLGGETIDLVIGYAFVHHIDNLSSFFNEINRILKPGGTCLFMDNAYSGFWQRLKLALWPIIYYFAVRRWGGISPQDEKYMFRGGYDISELDDLRKSFGFSELIFLRFSFFAYFFYRFTEILFGYNTLTDHVNNLIIPFLFKIDTVLSTKSSIFHNNTMLLVWGFVKYLSSGN